MRTNKNRSRKRVRGGTKERKVIRHDYVPIEKKNDNFVAYYKAQNILSSEEWTQFTASLVEPLPASFRINTFCTVQARILRNLVEGHKFESLLTTDASKLTNSDETSIVSDQNEVPNKTSNTPVLQCLKWYPNHLAWQMNYSRIDIRKSPILEQLHKFLIAETETGFISRQESVSMLPPLLLDVHKGQTILDMCAAPGSKTAQLIEYLQHDINADDTLSKEPNRGLNDGVVIANDVDNKRCYLLVHQSSRLNSPNCVIVNQDAAKMPPLFTIDTQSQQKIPLKFDRVLCDVPCSGDGTIRKNLDVWKKWNVANSNNFHGVQHKIAKRGLELLKKGGLLVYSTCSFNPTEDEAVISSLLSICKGSVVLEDVSNKLNDLKFIPGLKRWTVMGKDMKIIDCLSDVPPEYATQVTANLFPPDLETAKNFNLERCIRILPHLQNTGGFFVAVLRKIEERLPWEEDPTETIKEIMPKDSNDPQNPKHSKKKIKFTGFKEDPFIFVDEIDSDWQAIKKAYKIDDKFPYSQLVHRCTEGRKRHIYLVSKSAKDFITVNQETNSDISVKIINSGVRLFCRSDPKTGPGYRICQDGIDCLLPYINVDMCVEIYKPDLTLLLNDRGVSFEEFNSSAQEKFEKLEYGSIILMYKHDDENSNGKVELPLAAWRGQKTITLYVCNNYRSHLGAIAGIDLPNPSVKKSSEPSVQ